MRKETFQVNVICSDPERPIPFGNSADVKLLSCHLTPIRSGLQVREHEHSHWELSFMISGGMKTFCDENIIFCEEKNHSILLIPPGTLHRRKFGTHGKNCNLTIEFLLNDPEEIHDVLQQCLRSGYQFEPSPFLRSLLAEIRTLSRENTASPHWLLPSLSEVFLLTFLRDVLPVRSGRPIAAPADWKFRRNQARAKDIFRFLNTHISDKELLPELSAFFHLSLRQLNRIFGSGYHKTLAGAADEIRFRRSVLLLQDTALTIREIAAETGFSSPAGFHLFFKRHTGKTPQVFRRQATLS